MNPSTPAAGPPTVIRTAVASSGPAGSVTWPVRVDIHAHSSRPPGRTKANRAPGTLLARSVIAGSRVSSESAFMAWAISARWVTPVIG